MVNYLIFAGKVYSKQIKLPTKLVVCLMAEFTNILYINIKITIYTYCYDYDVCYMQTNVCVMYIQYSSIKSCHYPRTNWASEASPTLGCSIEISRDICRYVVCLSYVKLTA